MEEGVVGMTETISYDGIYRREGDEHVVAFAEQRIEMRFSRVHFGRDEIKGWLTVLSGWPQGPERLVRTIANMTGVRARSDLARILAGRCPVELDFAEMLEQACTAVIDAVEEGSPVVRLSEVAPRAGSRFRIEPISFEGHPVIWFGKGGAGKSTLLAAAAVGLHAGVDILGLPLEPGPVLICDWETDAETYREQVALLCAGHGISIPDIHYRECRAPLINEAEAIGRYIAREGIAVVGVDSLGQACGGDKNSQEIAVAMFGAMRSWQTTTILLDHVAKAEDSNTPYGSVYFETSARATWRAIGAMRDSVNYVGLTLEKSNLGRFQPVYWRFTFLPDAHVPEAMTCELVGGDDVPQELRGERMSQRDAIRRAFIEARQSLTAGDLHAMTGISEQVIRNHLAAMEKQGKVVKIVIRGAANKWALRSAREDDEAPPDSQVRSV
jgi:hypothetical protein